MAPNSIPIDPNGHFLPRGWVNEIANGFCILQNFQQLDTNFIEVNSVINIVESALSLPEAIESLKLPLIFDSFLQVMSV